MGNLCGFRRRRRYVDEHNTFQNPPQNTKPQFISYPPQEPNYPPPIEPSQPEPNDNIFIQLKTLEGNIINLSISLSQTVGEFKDQIRARLGYRNTPMIIFGGRRLDENRKMSSYNIQRGNVIHVVERFLGGLFFLF